MPMSRSTSPVPTSSPGPIDPIRFGYIQGILGLLLGGTAAIALGWTDPFQISGFPIAEGADAAQEMAASLRWKSSAPVLVGELTTAGIPLLASGLCGLLVHPSRPASLPAAL